MTSKISCRKMTMNVVKRRIWYGAVLLLIFFLGIPLNIMLRFGSKNEIAAKTINAIEKSRLLAEEQIRFQKFVGGGNIFLMMLVLGAALLGAWSGLYWLHSRKKMDMLGSLPVRREKLLLSESLAALILFAVPYLINLFLAFLVGISKGLVTGNTFPAMLAGCGIHFLYYIILYLCAAIAMLLTGKLLTGILGTMVFLVIGPVLYGILATFPEVFWKTYVGGFSGDWLSLLSPAVSFLIATTGMCEWTENGGSAFLTMPLISVIIMGVLFGALSIWLVKIRPAEGAENAMAFPKTEGIIKAVLLYPMGLGGGLFFMVIGTYRNGEEENLWFWFGLLFVLLVGSIIIEVIYHFDRRMILGHKRWTGIGMAAAIVTAAVFFFDLLGYDSWLPSEDDIKNAVFCAENYYYDYPDGSNNTLEYLENHLDELEGKAVLELAREGVEYLKNEELQDESERSIQVLFKMKNGSVKKRQYSVSKKSAAKAEEKLYEEEIYRKAVFPILLKEPADVVLVHISNLGQYCSEPGLTIKEKEELAAIYQEELENLEYYDIFAPGSGELQFKDAQSLNYINGSYPLNGNFEKTVKFLKEREVEAVKDLSEVEIVQMTFYRENEEFAVLKEKEITDPETIEKAKEDLVSRDRYWIENSWELDEDVYVNVTYQGEDELVSCECAYLKGKTPDIVKEILGE